MSDLITKLKKELRNLAYDAPFSLTGEMSGEELQEFLDHKKASMMKKFELAKSISEQTFKELKEKQNANDCNTNNH